MKTKLTLLFFNLFIFLYAQNPDATPQDDIYIKTIFNLQDYASGNNTYDIAFVAIEVKNDIDRNNYKIRHTEADGSIDERHLRQSPNPHFLMKYVSSTPPDYSTRTDSPDLLFAGTEIYAIDGFSSEGYDILNGSSGYGYSMMHDILGGVITNKHFARCWWVDLHTDFNNSSNTKIELLYNVNGTWTVFDVWEGPLQHNQYDQRNVDTPNEVFTASEWNRNQDSNSGVGTLNTNTVEFDSEIFIAPNPVLTDFQIQNLKKQTSYRILNTLGMMVQTEKISRGESVQTQNLNSGLYILVLNSGQYFKFLKKQN